MNHSRKQLEIDRISFQLGMINCFAEMVACGVKKLALSPPLTPEEYDKIKKASDDIVNGFGIQSYLEKSLLITDLQSEDFTKGKWSILYYKTDDVLQDYLDLKALKEQFEKEGRTDAHSRKSISRKFMQLLSYSEDVIEAKLNDKTPDPFMIVDL